MTLVTITRLGTVFRVRRYRNGRLGMQFDVPPQRGRERIIANWTQATVTYPD